MPFTEVTPKLLTHIAKQIAIAVENAARLPRDLQSKTSSPREALPPKKSRCELNFDQIVGRHPRPPTRAGHKKWSNVAPSDSTVCSGRNRHGQGWSHAPSTTTADAKTRTFVKLNCAAIPTGLFESERSGTRKGAFTGAISPKAGRLELADQGTLFGTRWAMCRWRSAEGCARLQEREFERLGSTPHEESRYPSGGGDES